MALLAIVSPLRGVVGYYKCQIMSALFLVVRICLEALPLAIQRLNSALISADQFSIREAPTRVSEDTRNLVLEVLALIVLTLIYCSRRP